jgi:hypothetical protein
MELPGAVLFGLTPNAVKHDDSAGRKRDGRIRCADWKTMLASTLRCRTVSLKLNQPRVTLPQN